MKFIPIDIFSGASNCPFCGVYSNFKWGTLAALDDDGRLSIQSNIHVIGQCLHCSGLTLWKNSMTYGDEKMLYPISGQVPLPNDDTPEDIKIDYLEASEIIELSPRGAAALLRLAIQKLCKHLGESGDNINADIKSLMKKGLNPMIQKALDSVRVTGNYAVHPGVLDLTDDRETAIKLFGFVNVIVDVMISQPKQIDDFYNLNVPEKDRVNIAKRDNPKTP